MAESVTNTPVLSTLIPTLACTIVLTIVWLVILVLMVRQIDNLNPFYNVNIYFVIDTTVLTVVSCLKFWCS